ncbi:MAG: hypothetical protein L0Z62_02450 [Gemmataceae bacterium]|nr:hypothetical protein [Gemmataceae bacterium]
MRVVIAADNPERQTQLRQATLGLGMECGAEDCASLANLGERVALAAPALVLVDVGGDLGAAQAAIQTVVSAHGVPVLAVGPAAHPQDILLTLRSGAREYIDQGRLREDLPLALQKLQLASGTALKRGRLFAVISASPGSGVTTVATNLAFALAQHHPRQVALAELGVQVPELSLILDIAPHNSISDMVSHWERLDATMVRQVAVEHPSGVYVLGHPPETLTTPHLDPTAVRQTLALLRTLYDCTVLDLGHRADDTTLEALTLAETVVAVVRIDVPSLRLCREFLKDLTRRGVVLERLRLVANRYGQRRQLSWRRVQEVVGLPVLSWIPDDPGTLNLAINKGAPLIDTARRARITRRFDQLARDLNGQPQGKG